MRLVFNISGIIVLIIIVLTIGLTIAWYAVSPGETAQYVNQNNQRIPNSIATEEYIELGGLKQYVLIRGKSTNNPVILLLHGGPGTPQTHLFTYYNKDLEDHFITVNWDLHLKISIRYLFF